MVHAEKFSSTRTAQKGFERLKKGADNLKDLLRSGRLVEFEKLNLCYGTNFGQKILRVANVLNLK